MMPILCGDEFQMPIISKLCRIPTFKDTVIDGIIIFTMKYTNWRVHSWNTTYSLSKYFEMFGTQVL